MWFLMILFEKNVTKLDVPASVEMQRSFLRSTFIPTLYVRDLILVFCFLFLSMDLRSMLFLRNFQPPFLF